MKLVNTVYKGTLLRIPENFDFLYRKKLPQMLVSKKNGVTLLIFNGLKFRIMGRITLTEAKRLLPIKDIALQTRTFVHNFNKTINLYNFRPSPNYSFLYEPELFNSLLLRITGGGSINLFASGKIVLLGSLTYSQWRKHLKYIRLCINNSTLTKI